MRKKLVLGLIAVIVSVAVPAGVYWRAKPNDNQFNDTLRGFGYRPLPLPTSEMTVGAIYQIDSKVRFFDVVCDVEPGELTGAIKRTTSGPLAVYLQTGRQFDSDVKVDLGWLLNSNANANEKQTVNFSLSDIVEEWITQEKSIELFINMANRPHCTRAIKEAMRGGGYVCQGLKVLEATAEYKLDQDTMGKIGAKATARDLNNIVKLAVEAQSGTEVVERQSKVQSGKKLKYAVAMKPTCMIPSNGWFERILPESGFERMINYLLFHVIEPFWPASEDQTRTAEAEMRLADAN